MNLNPMLSVAKDGTVLYSNEASRPLLQEWGAGTGGKLPSSIMDIVQSIISRNSPEKIEVRVGNKLYLVVFSPLPEEQRVSISGFDISDQKEFEKDIKSEVREKAERDKLVEELRKSEKKYRTLFETIDEGFCVIEVLFDGADCPIDYRFLEINAAFERQTGIKNAVGRRMRQIAPEHEEYWFQIYGNVALTGEPLRFENPALALGRNYDVYAFRIGDPYQRRVGILFNDITERKRAEEALRESENLFRTLFEYTDDAFQIVELIFENGKVSDFRYLQTNAAFENQSGLKSSEVAGKTVKEILPNVEPHWFEMYGRVIKEGRSLRDVSYNQDTRRWYEMFYFPYGEGKVGVLFTDITDKKRAEEALYESEELYKVLFEKTQDGFVLVDPIFDETGNSDDYRMLKVNDAWERQTGLRAVDFVGKRIRDAMPDVEHVWPATFAGVARKGTAKHFESYNANSGQWYDLHAFPYREGQVGVLFRDITKRKRAEEALKDQHSLLTIAMDATHTGWGNWNWETGEAEWSEEGKRIMGFASDEEATTAEGWLRRIHPEDRPKVEAHAAQAAGEHRDFNTEYRVVHPDGSVRYLLGTGRIIYDENDKPISSTGLVIDITKSKRAEEALRESEEKYRSIVETAQEGIWLIDQNDRTIFANQKMSDMLGFSIDEILGQSPQKFMAPEFRIKAEDRLIEHIQGTKHVIDYRFIRKDGSSLWCILSSNPLFDNRGKYSGSLAMVTDITERKRAEEELRESKARIESIFRSSPIGIGIVVDRVIKEVNDRLCEITGYSREEMLGKSALMLYPTEEEFERVGMVKYGMIVERGMGYVETRWQRKDGSVVDILLSSSPIVQGSMSGEITFTALDITERKHAEEALKIVNETLEEKVKERSAELEKAYNLLKESEKGLAEAQKIAHIGSWERNLATGKIFWSEEMYRIFGFEPQEFNATYESFLSLVYPDDRDTVDKAVKGALKGKSFAIDYRIARDDGKKRIVHARGEATFNNNTPVLIRGVVQDITERKQAEEALAKIDEVRIKEIHHRIKNNLQVISSLLDLQTETFSHFETCKTSEVMEAFMESQNRVASMALIHEELYKGKDSEALDFAEYLRKLTANLLNSYNLKNNDISLKLNFEQVYLGMDTAIPLGIIVNELVSNPLKHAFPSGKQREISIALHRTENFTTNKENGELGSRSDNNCKYNNFCYRLNVADNGKGMPKEINFQNAGTLGLQLVNILVDQIDGCIELKRNKGTEFTIFFSNIAR